MNPRNGTYIARTFNSVTYPHPSTIDKILWRICCDCTYDCSGIIFVRCLTNTYIYFHARVKYLTKILTGQGLINCDYQPKLGCWWPWRSFFSKMALQLRNSLPPQEDLPGSIKAQLQEVPEDGAIYVGFKHHPYGLRFSIPKRFIILNLVPWSYFTI